MEFPLDLLGSVKHRKVMSHACAHVPIPHHIDRFAEIASQYDVVLCDVWGVLHNGVCAFPGASEALTQFRQGGGKVILITNAPRPNRLVLPQMKNLGVLSSAFDGIVTSGDVTIESIVQQGRKKAYHIGPDRELALFEDAAKISGHKIQLADLAQADYVVCTGLFHDDIETPSDYFDDLDQMRARNMVMICANPDLVVHCGPKLLYCAGALGRAYKERGGTVIQAGKPFAPIYTQALALAQAGSHARVLAIGDGLPTDIQGAADQNIDALFITDGIHREDVRDDAAIHKLLGAHDLAPRYAMGNLV